MNKGIKITLSALTVAGIAVLVYYMFFKKDSSLYVLKPKFERDGEEEHEHDEEDEEPHIHTPVSTGGSSTGGSSTGGSCPYPEVPFKNNTEGNKFRGWVSMYSKSLAKELDLDAVGTASNSYNNCHYIRKAYAYKVSGGRTLGSLFQSFISGNQIDDSTPTTTTDDTELQWAQFKNRVSGQGIKYSTNPKYILVKLNSSEAALSNFNYRMSYWKTGAWMLKMQKGSGNFEIIAKGTYNLDSRWKSATKTIVTSGKSEGGASMVGLSYTAVSRILWGAQRVIKRYWKSGGMTTAQASTIKSYS